MHDTSLQVILDSVDEAYYTLDDAWRFTYANRAALAMWGKSLEDIRGRAFLDCFPQAAASAPYEAHQRVMERRVGERFETVSPVLHRWIQATIAPMDDGGLLVSIRDIAARKRAEADLQVSEDRLHSVLDAITEAFTLVNRDFTIVDVNAETVRLDGRRREALVGRSLWDAFPDTEHSAVGALLRRVQETRVPDGMEHTYQWPDGRGMWIDMRAYPIRDDGVAIFWRDVTARARASEALRESEERLALAVTIGELASWDWDLRSGAVTWNDRHFLLQGYAVGEVTPSFDAWLARVHPDDRSDAVARIEAARDTKAEFVHEFRSLPPDGSVRWCSARGRFFYDASGEPYRMVGVMNDITQRKREERHRDALLRLDDALRNARTDADTRTAAFRLLAEALDAPVVYWWESEEDLVHVDVYEASRASASRRELSALPFDDDALVTLRAGRVNSQSHVEPQALTTNARLLAGETEMRARVDVPLLLDGKLVGGLGVVDTNAREWQGDECVLVEQFAARGFDAMQRSRAESALLVADKRKDEFLAMLAHELRNPLAPIRSSVDVLRLDDDEEDGRHRQLLGRIDRQLTHMVRLVDDLMDVSRISRGQLRLRLEPTVIQSVIDEAVESCSYDVQRFSHTLTVDVTPSLPVLLIDRPRMVQVVCNLLTNAAKYTDRGGRIQLRAYVDGAWLCISVRDTGIGIEPHLHESVFELFTQVKQTEARAQSGLGIGLSLVRQLMQLHGGDVMLESEVGRGSTFTVRLPLTRRVDTGARDIT